MLLLVAGLAVFASACRVDTAVEVEVEDDGSGLVTVVFTADADAVTRVPELAEGLRLDDVRAAGWAVDGPISRGDGGTEVRAVKEFESASQLSVLLAELAGDDVIFSEVVLEQTRSFAKSAYEFGAVVNPTPPVEAFSDGALAAIFDGQPFGRPLEDLIAEAGRPQDSLGLQFSVTLLDSDDSFIASASAWSGPQTDLASLAPEVDGSTATWRFSYGDPAVRVGASTVLEDTVAPLWLNIARAAALGFALVVLGVAVAWVVTLVRTPKGRGRRATRRRTAAGRGARGRGQPAAQAPAASAGGGRAWRDRAAHRPAGGLVAACDPAREPRHRPGAGARPAPASWCWGRLTAGRVLERPRAGAHRARGGDPLFCRRSSWCRACTRSSTRIAGSGPARRGGRQPAAGVGYEA